MPGLTVLTGTDALLSACVYLQFKGSWVDGGLGHGFTPTAASGAFALYGQGCDSLGEPSTLLS